MLSRVKSWIKKLIRLFTRDKENDEKGFITIGEIIPTETKRELYKMVN